MTSSIPIILTTGLLLFLPLLPSQASLVISEFLADNQLFSVDEDGDSSDWIEIWNASDEPAGIGGYSLTDDPQAPDKWIFPEITLPPRGFLLIFASGKDRIDPESTLHASFSLERQGEFLGLYAPGISEPLSSFNPSFPKQFTDVAYGITGEMDNAGYLMTPTPGSPNDEALQGFVSDTQFSIHRGFYSSPITVTITSATEAAEIYYTLDGSEPSAQNGMLYTEPVTIDSTTILRAIAVRAGYLSSNVDTQTYLFPSSIKNQRTMDERVTEAAEYKDLIEEALGGTLPALSINGDQEAIFGLNGIYTQFDRSGREAEVPISLEYFSPTDPEDTFHLAAGLRIHGGNARSHPKKPLRLYFRKDYSGGSGELEHSLFPGSNVDSFEQLILRSCGHDSWSLADSFGGSDFDLPAHASFLRDQFVRLTENDMGLLSPLGKYVHVYLNGVYWGVYDLHERPNAAYFSDHLGGAKADWDVVHHPEFSDETYSVVDGNADAWESLQDIARGQVASEAGFERIQNLVNLDAYLDSMIARMWSGDYDWVGPIFRGTDVGNETVYRNVTVFGNKNWYAGGRFRNGGEGKFHFFSWDAEMSMGLHLMFNLLGNSIPQRVINFDLSRVNDPGSPVAPYDSLISYPPFQRAFADRLAKHLNNGGALTPEKTKPRMQSLIDQLDVPVIAESARWGNTAPNGRVFTRNDDWLPEVEWLRDTFLEERGDAMLKGFRDHGIFPQPSAPLLSQQGGFLTQGQSLTLSTSDPQAEIYYTTDGTDPAEFPEVELLEVLPRKALCKWLVPNATNGGFSSQFRWTLISGAPNERLWWDGRIGLGFESNGQDFKGLYDTDVGEVMQVAQGTGLYCRVPFSIPSQQALDNMDALILHLRFDDGFVAYINGAQVVARNAPAQTTGRSSALETRPNEDAIIEESFDVTSAVRDRLVVGSNILALHGLNSPEDSEAEDRGDFLLAPRMQLRREISSGGPSSTAKTTGGKITLTESSLVKARILDQFGRWSALTEAYFHLEAPLQPGDIAISEIHYNPSPPRQESELALANERNQFEFLELRNQRDVPLELHQAAFTQGIRFTFPQLMLAPGERILLVRNEAAFTARYGTEAAARIVGTFQRDSRLSDTGERLTLISKEGETLIGFRYNDKDPWPEAADGDGSSLVYRPATADADPGDAIHWAASLDPDGYPGSNGFTRYADWVTRYFQSGDPELSAFDADPDEDNISNIFEYVFGSHPLRPTEKTRFMTFATMEIDGEDRPVFQFLRRPDMEDIDFSLDLSSDLETWVTTDLVEEELLIERNIHNRDRANVPLETPITPNGYARLRATLAEIESAAPIGDDR